MEGILSIITAVISVISTGIASYAIAYSKTLQDRDLNHQNYEDIKIWYEETLLVLKQLYLEFADTNAKFDKKDLNSKLAELSAKIDSSRIFLSNKRDGEFCENKPETFRGRKTLILDFLCLYYDIFQQDKQQNNINVLRSVQRAFISEMTRFLKQNRNSKNFVPYDVYDCNNIVSIENIENANFRRILLSEDIVSLITKNQKRKDFVTN